MQKKEIIHDGSSIKIYATEDPDKVIIHFTDDITAFYKTKKAIILDKGICCNNISAMVSKLLSEGGVPTHFISQLSPREQLCRRVDVIPLEVIVRNVVAGSLASRLGIEEGLVPPEPVIELCYKSDELGDPLINGHHALALGLVDKEELKWIMDATDRINAILVPVFEKAGIRLVDYKIEFGRLREGGLVMADDITPDSARFWDIETGMRLDKDRFRRDESRVGESYRLVYERLKNVTNEFAG